VFDTLKALQPNVIFDINAIAYLIGVS